MNRKHRPPIALLLGLVLLLPMGPAAAGIIFDNGDASTLGGAFVYRSDFATDASGAVGAASQKADDFLLVAGSNIITDIHWWGTYWGGTAAATDDFTIRIFADDSGATTPTPKVSPLYENTTATVTRKLFGGNAFEYSADIAPLALAPNTTYWLSIVNDTATSIDDGWAWFASTAGNQVPGATRSADGELWFGGALGHIPNLPFQLTNDNLSVPVPGTLTLLVPGLLLLARRRRLQA